MKLLFNELFPLLFGGALLIDARTCTHTSWTFCPAIFESIESLVSEVEETLKLVRAGKLPAHP